MECAQIEVTGGSGSASPKTVSFPGAYSGSDPGIKINIYQTLDSYTIPGKFATWTWHMSTHAAFRPGGVHLLGAHWRIILS